MNISIQDRDLEILETLTLRVHLVTLEQAAKAWWPSSVDARPTRQRLARLESAGLVERHRVNIHPMLPLTSPVVFWSPSFKPPKLGPAAWRLQSRWTESQRLTTVYIATRKAADRFGGFGGKFKHRTQLTHDVHVAEIFFLKLRDEKSTADRWKGEELLAKADDGEKVPDALLTDDHGLPNCVVEFGGRYDKRRLEKFHRYCASRGIGYELW